MGNQSEFQGSKANNLRTATVGKVHTGTDLNAIVVQERHASCWRSRGSCNGCGNSNGLPHMYRALFLSWSGIGKHHDVPNGGARCSSDGLCYRRTGAAGEVAAVAVEGGGAVVAYSQ